jgi:hypothetical protein
MNAKAVHPAIPPNAVVSGNGAKHFLRQPAHYDAESLAKIFGFR